MENNVVKNLEIVITKNEEDLIFKYSQEYGEAYIKAVEKVLRGMRLPEGYTKQLLNQIHALALPSAGGKAAAKRATQLAEAAQVTAAAIADRVQPQVDLNTEKADKTEEGDLDEKGRRGPITYKSAHPNGTPLADINEPWQPTKEVAKADGDAKALWKMHGSNDGSSEAVAQGYDFAHHAGDDTQKCLCKAVQKSITKCNKMLKSVEKDAGHGDKLVVGLDHDELQAILSHLQQHMQEFEDAKDAIDENDSSDGDSGDDSVSKATKAKKGKPASNDEDADEEDEEESQADADDSEVGPKDKPAPAPAGGSSSSSSDSDDDSDSDSDDDSDSDSDDSDDDDDTKKTKKTKKAKKAKQDDEGMAVGEGLEEPAQEGVMPRKKKAVKKAKKADGQASGKGTANEPTGSTEDNDAGVVGDDSPCGDDDDEESQQKCKDKKDKAEKAAPKSAGSEEDAGGCLSYADCHPDGSQTTAKAAKFDYAGEKEKAAGNVKALKAMHAHFDGGNPRNPAQWSIAHHEAAEPNKVSFDGIKQAVNKLDKCVQKAEASQDDIKKMMTHLQTHMTKDFKLDPPWLSEENSETDPTASGAKPGGDSDSSNAASPNTTKADLHPDCQKVKDNCMKMKEKGGETDAAAEADCDKVAMNCSQMKKMLKAIDTELEKDAHHPSGPIADTGAWDGAAAQKRMVAWASDSDGNINFSKLKQGYLWSAPGADTLQDLKFPVCDIIDGQLKVSRAALSAAASYINSSKGIPSDELDSMKATLRGFYNKLGLELPPGLQKADVPTFIGESAEVLFVAASPGPVEKARGEPLVGPTGFVFKNEYLKPLGLDWVDIGAMYLVPNLLKGGEGKTREPMQTEIDHWSEWFYNEISKADVPIIVALGYTVKKALGDVATITLPHPNAIERHGAREEVERKLKQVRKALNAVRLEKMATQIRKEKEEKRHVRKTSDKRLNTDSGQSNTVITNVEKATFQYQIKILKSATASQKKQVVYGVVLEPNDVDLQKDWVSPDMLEEAAWNFLVASRVVGDYHQKQAPAEVVESYIAPVDFTIGTDTVKKGSWVVGVHISNGELWNKVESGEYNSFSIGGFSQRIPSLPPVTA